MTRDIEQEVRADVAATIGEALSQALRRAMHDVYAASLAIPQDERRTSNAWGAYRGTCQAVHELAPALSLDTAAIFRRAERMVDGQLATIGDQVRRMPLDTVPAR
jgi:hypothetical protein